MKNRLLNQLGFTLIEMLVVLMIISVLLLIAIPNMSKNNEVVSEKGCKATVNLLQTQVHAYQIEKGKLPENLDVLKTDKYIETTKCPDETQLTMNTDGKVLLQK